MTMVLPCFTIFYSARGIMIAALYCLCFPLHQWPLTASCILAEPIMLPHAAHEIGRVTSNIPF